MQLLGGHHPCRCQHGSNSWKSSRSESQTTPGVLFCFWDLGSGKLRPQPQFPLCHMEMVIIEALVSEGKKQLWDSASCFCSVEKVLGHKPANKTSQTAFLFFIKVFTEYSIYECFKTLKVIPFLFSISLKVKKNNNNSFPSHIWVSNQSVFQMVFGLWLC